MTTDSTPTPDEPTPAAPADQSAAASDAAHQAPAVSQPAAAQASAAPAGATPPPPAQPPHPHAVTGAVPPAFQAPAAPARKRRGAGVVAAVAIAAIVGGGIGTAGTYLLVNNVDGVKVSSDASGPQTVTINNPDSVNLVSAVAAKASPSVVTISASSTSASGTGSGVVLSADGYVVTNTHVVTLDGETGDATIKVTTSDGTIYNATVVGTDPTLDLAVIKLEGASGLTPITFADSDSINVGDATVAIGAPLGLSGSVTTGVVSAVNRSITVASSAAPDDSESDGQQQEGEESPFNFWGYGDQGQTQTQATTTIALPVIQTDASINPGNSGGALLDSDGELIGINVAIASAGSSSSTDQSGSIGIGFAVPSNVVKRVTDEIIADGTASHGLLGANVYDAASRENATVAGAGIDSVTPDGAAAAAGIESGDVITEFDGHPVTDANDLTAQVRSLAAGATAEVTYVRDGQTYSVSVTLGSADS